MSNIKRLITILIISFLSSLALQKECYSMKSIAEINLDTYGIKAYNINGEIFTTWPTNFINSVREEFFPKMRSDAIDALSKYIDEVLS